MTFCQSLHVKTAAFCRSHESGEIFPVYLNPSILVTTLTLGDLPNRVDRTVAM